uniref:Regulator of chromosome condensation 2 n=1 Tax=Ficedula albicollis TaxID=59894 RepID=U3JI32_FICAL
MSLSLSLMSLSLCPQKLEGSRCRGQLLIFGATNWDLIGRKEVPKQQAAYRNLGQNLWGPHRYGSLGSLRVRSVVSGPCAAHSLLITAEGRLWSWGRNEKGQLGHGDTKRVEAPRPIEALAGEAIVAAACGRNHTLALTENGSVFAFGENKLGQLGLGNQTDAVPSPTQILYNGQPISKLGCGAEFSMVMDCKGNLYSFGCPEYGQLGHNSDGKFIARAQRIEYDCELLPRRLALFVERTKDGQVLPVPNVVVRDVACGANHTLVLDSQKRVFSWGFGGYGRLGHAEQKDEMVPRLVKLFDFPGRGASQIYAGYTCSFAVSETGGLFFWGATNTSRESTMYPKAVQDLCGWKIRSLACGKSSVIVAADESPLGSGQFGTIPWDQGSSGPFPGIGAVQDHPLGWGQFRMIPWDGGSSGESPGIGAVWDHSLGSGQFRTIPWDRGSSGPSPGMGAVQDDPLGWGQFRRIPWDRGSLGPFPGIRAVQDHSLGSGQFRTIPWDGGSSGRSPGMGAVQDHPAVAQAGPVPAFQGTIPTGSSSRGRSASSTTASCCRGAWRCSWSAPRTGKCCPCPTWWSGTWPAGPTTRYGVG